MFGKRFSRALAVTTAGTLIMASAAFANDKLTADADLATSDADQTYTNNSLAAGATATFSFSLYVRAQSGGNEPDYPIDVAVSTKPSWVAIHPDTSFPVTIDGVGTDHAVEVMFVATGQATASSGMITFKAYQGGTTTELSQSEIQTADSSFTVNVSPPADSAAPVTSATPSGTAGDNGWYKSNVSIDLSATDNAGGSGVKEIIYSLSGATTLAPNTVAGSNTSFTLSNEGTTTITFQARDNAGNLETAQTLEVKIDKTAPSASLSVFAGTAGANGWHTSDLTIRTSGTDETSGIVSCTPDQFQAAETTGATFNGSCTDGAGWTTNADALTVKLDKTGPTAALSVIGGTEGDNGWYISDVTVQTSGTDTVSNPTICSASQTLTSETIGEAVNGSCTNDAGLTTNAAPLTIKIDKSGPTVTPGSVTDPAWRNSPLSEEFTASDDYSGLNLSAGALSGTNKFTLTAAAESADASTPTVVSGTVYDNAGHGTTRFVSAKIDLTDPAVTCGATPTFALNQAGAMVSATVSDVLSGPVATSVSGAANTALVSGGTVALTGTDNAGNSTTVNCPYNIASVMFGKPIEGPSVMNIAKLGRVIPVKATVLLNGTPIGSSDGPVSIGGLGNVNCQTGVTSDTVEEYAPAGSSNYGNLFRWDSVEGRWMYNYDTSALKGNSCYRINVHLGGEADENGRVTGGSNIGYFLIKVGK